MQEFLIGAHLSVAGGIHFAVKRAVSLGFNCVQLFTHSPRTWNANPILSDEIIRFKEHRKKIKYVVVHAPYLPNLASPRKKLLDKSKKTILNDLIIADKIDADYYVVHPGSHKNFGIEAGIDTIANTLSEIFETITPKLTFLLETMPGAGSIVGSSFDELALIIEKIKAKNPNVKLGVCIDTAHIFAAGFDIRKFQIVKSLVEIIDNSIGKNAVKLIHANDSFEALGSKKDRHNHIGKGEIGIKGFENMMKIPLFAKLPWILETPKTDDNSDIINKNKLQKIFKNQYHS